MVEDVLLGWPKIQAIKDPKVNSNEIPARRAIDATTIYLKEIGYSPLLTAAEEVAYTQN